MKELKAKILNKKAVISIVGLGYVGLPLAIEFLKKGFSVNGIDVDQKRIDLLRKCKSYILDLKDEDLKSVFRKSNFKVSCDYKSISGSDVIIICVPTPLRKTGEPDLSYVLEAAQKIKKTLKKSTLVILESTTYPGTTKEIILPLLSSSNFKVGRDFYLAFSPERIDPGNKKYHTVNIPKIIGGYTQSCLKLAVTLYGQILKEVVPVSSPGVAEMVKVLENSFRSVNIALANEVAIVCNRLGINVWEVIEAAKTKPFGFMPFYPGPGIGGHCIPTDPMYLVWKARLLGYEPKLIKTAQEINSYMPHYVVDKLLDMLNRNKKALKGANILILGVTYKADVNDLRESPALEIIQGLNKKGARVSFYDPYVKELKIEGKSITALSLNRKNINRMDVVLIVTDHSNVNYSLLRCAKLILDCRNTIHWKSKNLTKI